MTVLSPGPSPRVIPGQSWSVRPPPVTVTVTTLGLCFLPPRGSTQGAHPEGCWNVERGRASAQQPCPDVEAHLPERCLPASSAQAGHGLSGPSPRAQQKAGEGGVSPSAPTTEDSPSVAELGSPGPDASLFQFSNTRQHQKQTACTRLCWFLQAGLTRCRLTCS